MMSTRRNFIILVASVLTGMGTSFAGTEPSASGFELIMVEEVGCRFCRKWEADVGGAYPASPEGQYAPIRRVRRGTPDIAGFAPVVYTPTFLLVKDSKELGRITGYPGQSFFWEELATLLASTGFKAGESPKKS